MVLLILFIVVLVCNINFNLTSSRILMKFEMGNTILSLLLLEKLRGNNLNSISFGGVKL